jgi:hypothetical protein
MVKLEIPKPLEITVNIKDEAYQEYFKNKPDKK